MFRFIKRFGLWSALVGLGLLLLAACGDTASPTVAPAAATPTTAASQPTKAATSVPAMTTAMGAMSMAPGTTMAATIPAATTAVAATTMAAMTTALATSAPAMISPAATTAAPASGAVTEVSIENFNFSPANLTVPAGTKVIWTNKDSTAHTVTSDNKLLNSKLLEQGQKFEFVFNEATTVEYYCIPHPFMKGKITVTAK